MSRHRNNQTEEQFDFDLNNYKMEDLYRLFKLQPEEPLNEQALKKARRILLFVHPDKSGLHQKYFQFYSKAYKILEEMEGIVNSINKKKNELYVDDVNTYSNEIHNSIKEMSVNVNSSNKRTSITKEFNARFEELNKDMLPQNDNRGYANWLKDENPEENVKNHKELYTKRKKELRDQYALSTNKIQPPSFYSSSGSSLLDQNDDFTSGLFDPMQYTDLKKSYTETVIPVSEEDYENTPTYRTIDDYKRAREVNTADKSLYRDHTNILNRQQEEDRRMSDYRAYELARQLEASEQKNRMFASQFYKILN
jgi:hypothetical protein